MLARGSKHCRFRSRLCWKNGTFSVYSYAMTIDKSKFEKNGNAGGHAGGTIVELYNRTFKLINVSLDMN